MSGGGEGEGTTLEYTPTWVVAAICTVIVAISLALERLLHYAGKVLLFFLRFILFHLLFASLCSIFILHLIIVSRKTQKKLDKLEEEEGSQKGN